MGVDVITFGCRLNAYESEVIRRNAEAAGLADTVVVNTCAVTAEAVRQAKQAIRKLGRERPDARIVVTGCAAQIDPQMFVDMPNVGRVLGNEEKLDSDPLAPNRGFARRARVRGRRDEKSRRQRHHVGEGDCRPLSTGSKAAPARSCRCRTAATTAAPSASSPMAAAIRARCRWARWWRRCAG